MKHELQSSSWIELSRSALAHNLKLVRKVVGSTVLLAPTIKANAYGHGLREYLSLLQSLRVSTVCVNAAWELEQARQAGFDGQIFMMGPVFPEEVPSVVHNRGTLFLYGKKTVLLAQKAAEAAKSIIPVILLIDTGMTRDGVLYSEATQAFQAIQKSPNVRLVGLATHFATADEPQDQTIFNLQLNRYREIESKIDPNRELPLTTLGNSATALLHTEAHGRVVRPGISCYGLSPSADVQRMLNSKKLTFQPMLSWKTRLAKVMNVPKGQTISYGATYITKKPAHIGLLPIGYYDGYDRHLSNKGEVLIRGQRAPIVGRVCMNMCMVDLTGILMAGCQSLFGRQKS